MQQQEYFQKLNNDMQVEIREELSKISFPFPDDFEFGDFHTDIDNILTTSSLNELKIDKDIHIELVNKNLNLFNITFILNAFANKSPKELYASPEEYNAILDVAYSLGEIHTKHAKPIQEKIQAKYQKKADKWQKDQEIKQAAAQKRNGKKVIPLNRN